MSTPYFRSPLSNDRDEGLQLDLRFRIVLDLLRAAATNTAALTTKPGELVQWCMAVAEAAVADAEGREWMQPYPLSDEQFARAMGRADFYRTQAQQGLGWVREVPNGQKP
jgi:hypothetical protein